jgi:hypothetical protein
VLNSNEHQITDTVDYQAVFPGCFSYYKDKDNQISYIGIDSIYEDNKTNIIYIPDRNILETTNSCYTYNESSWIGREIILTNDGYNLFLNKVSDTIRIKTDAEVDEDWTAYVDQGFGRIDAKVTSHDTISLLGFVDSIKTIGFTVYDTNGNLFEHEINNMSIKLSKRHGFVKTLNFHFFPNFYSERIEWGEEDMLEEFDLVGLSNPNLGILNLTKHDIFDYSIGDELHILYDDHAYGPHCSTTRRIIQKSIYSILSRTDLSDTIIYKVWRRSDRFTSLEYNDSSSYIYYNDTISWVITPDSILDKKPGEPVLHWGGYSTNNMYDWDRLIVKRIPGYTTRYEYNSDTCWKISTGWFGGCYYDEEYYKGLGGPYYWCMRFHNTSCGGHQKNQLVYYKKGTNVWGDPLSLALGTNIESANRVEIFPNPASDYFVVKGHKTNEGLLLIRIFDLTGKMVLSKQHGSCLNECRVNIESLPAGIYIIDVNNITRTKLIKL